MSEPMSEPMSAPWPAGWRSLAGVVLAAGLAGPGIGAAAPVLVVPPLAAGPVVERPDILPDRPAAVAPPVAPGEAPGPRSAPADAGPAQGNPLWSVPLSRLGATRQRPLFAPTRRPPALPPIAAAPRPVVRPVEAAPPPPPEKPSLQLVGTVAGPETTGLGVFVDTATKTVLRLKVGQDHKGWILRDVQLRAVALEKGLDREVLTIPPPETTSRPPGTPPGPPAGMPTGTASGAPPIAQAPGLPGPPRPAPGAPRPGVQGSGAPGAAPPGVALPPGLPMLPVPPPGLPAPSVDLPAGFFGVPAAAAGSSP